MTPVGAIWTITATGMTCLATAWDGLRLARDRALTRLGPVIGVTIQPSAIPGYLLTLGAGGRITAARGTGSVVQVGCGSRAIADGVLLGAVGIQ
jgi:hypothetical protein